MGTEKSARKERSQERKERREETERREKKSTRSRRRWSASTESIQPETFFLKEKKLYLVDRQERNGGEKKQADLALPSFSSSSFKNPASLFTETSTFPSSSVSTSKARASRNPLQTENEHIDFPHTQIHTRRKKTDVSM